MKTILKMKNETKNTILGTGCYLLFAAIIGLISYLRIEYPEVMVPILVTFVVIMVFATIFILCWLASKYENNRLEREIDEILKK
jgi:VIT1/CCC1 family predicted Fe2+/Mn2+ transporter